MKFPQIKHPLLCTILIYAVVILAFITPAVIVAFLPFISEGIKAAVALIAIIGLLIYTTKNFVLLSSMEIMLAVLACHNSARKQFKLRDSFSVKAVEDKISRFGKKCDPQPKALPQPENLRYKIRNSLSAYSSGVEKIIATYYTSSLDKNMYLQILNSAKANARALKGKTKYFVFGDPKAPLTRVMVIVIYAKTVDETLRENLYQTVCKSDTADIESATIPCVVDIEKSLCTFSNEKLINLFGCPARNYGIKIIKKYLFNNKFTYAESSDRLDPIEDVNPEQSLWEFWRQSKKELVEDDKKDKKRFSKMKHKEIIFEDDFLYLKLNERVLTVGVESDEEKKTVLVDAVDFWHYPKMSKISKADAGKMQDLIVSYFAERGYTTQFDTE